MSGARDNFWRRVLADHRPRPIEMAAAERQMRAAGVVASVPVGHIYRRRGALVLMALLVICAFGFVGTRVHWPTRKAPVLVL